MTPLRNESGSPRGSFVNPLPRWILTDQRWHSYRGSIRRTLQTIADFCNPPGASGDLIGAIGGHTLIKAAGHSERTFWRHVDRLTSDGFLVVLLRGGNLGKTNAGNTYGIPGKTGSLSGCRRREQIMTPGEDGKHRPQIIEPGDQPKLWTFSRPRTCHGGTDKMTRGSCQNDTLPSPSPSPSNNHGGSRPSGKKPRRGRRWFRVERAQLTDTVRLLELHDELADKGFVGRSEAERLKIVSAAEHVLGLGGDVAARFAAMIRGGQWIYITQDDENRAIERLRLHRSGAKPPAPKAPAVVVNPITEEQKIKSQLQAMAKSIGGGGC